MQKVNQETWSLDHLDCQVLRAQMVLRDQRDLQVPLASLVEKDPRGILVCRDFLDPLAPLAPLGMHRTFPTMTRQRVVIKVYPHHKTKVLPPAAHLETQDQEAPLVPREGSAQWDNLDKMASRDQLETEDHQVPWEHLVPLAQGEKTEIRDLQGPQVYLAPPAPRDLRERQAIRVPRGCKGTRECLELRALLDQ